MVLDPRKLRQQAKKFLETGRCADRAPVVRVVAGWLAHGVTDIDELCLLTGFSRHKVCFARCVINDPKKRNTGPRIDENRAKSSAAANARYHGDAKFREGIKAGKREKWLRAHPDAKPTGARRVSSRWYE